MIVIKIYIFISKSVLIVLIFMDGYNFLMIQSYGSFSSDQQARVAGNEVEVDYDKIGTN